MHLLTVCVSAARPILRLRRVLTLVSLVCRHNDSVNTNAVGNLDDFLCDILLFSEVHEGFGANFHTKLPLFLTTVDDDRPHAHCPV